MLLRQVFYSSTGSHLEVSVSRLLELWRQAGNLQEGSRGFRVLWEVLYKKEI